MGSVGSGVEALTRAANEPSTVRRQEAALGRWEAESEGRTAAEAAVRTVVRDLLGPLATTTILSRAKDLSIALYKAGHPIDREPLWRAALRAIRRAIGPVPGAKIMIPLPELWRRASTLRGDARRAAVLMLQSAARYTSVREARVGDLVENADGSAVWSLRHDKRADPTQVRRHYLPPAVAALLRPFPRVPPRLHPDWRARPRWLRLPQRWPHANLLPVRAIRRAVETHLAEQYPAAEVAEATGHSRATLRHVYLQGPTPLERRMGATAAAGAARGGARRH